MLRWEDAFKQALSRFPANYHADGAVFKEQGPDWWTADVVSRAACCLHCIAFSGCHVQMIMHLMLPSTRVVS